jgi:hypothetical protein
MNEKVSYEILRAFASTKPTEFDSFHRDWIRDHPAILESVEIIEPQPKRQKRKPKPKVIENSVVFEPEPEEQTEEEKPSEEE